ncbi:MAG: hypothetical protein U0359_24215 [Byssovorax sp.]
MPPPLRIPGLFLALGLAACHEPRPVAPLETGVPAPPAATSVASAPSAPPAPSLTASVAPPAPPVAPSFLFRTASRQNDFRLDMAKPCESGDPGCAGPASLHVLTKEGAEIQRIDLDLAWISTGDDGAPLVNTAELYERQGTINTGDFDFDGREDFAVQVDQSGPYGGPTFAVFLRDPKEDRFTRSEALSRLTQETLGFFQVDTAKKRIRTMEKSGCCIHVSEEHEVVRGTPRVTFRRTENAMDDDVVITEERLVGGRWQKKTHRETAQP